MADVRAGAQVGLMTQRGGGLRLGFPPLMRLLLLLLVVIASLVPAACGGDDDANAGGGGGGQSDAAEEPTPSEQREALKDTSAKPVIPKPTGSPPRRLVKEDIVKGKGKPAKPGDAILVHYVGVTFSTNQEVDSSWDHAQPFPLQLGVSPVIEGWTRGLVGIRKGGRRMLTIPPELAYGPDGDPPTIPPNETLVFVLDALDIKHR
jgi:peptidylprolyl isomerase